jgi:hypothetical protein
MKFARIGSFHRLAIAATVAVATAAGVASCASPDKPGLGNGQGGCTDGNACTTDNPGACRPGHTVCTDGKPVCMPDVTTQSCYGNEPETLGRGPCHAGTQSCIGALGPCMGAVLPQPESCFNEVDDDCDGHVNDGCPNGLHLGDPVPLPARGGSGGNPVTTMCPAGAVVVGVDVLLSTTDKKPGYVVSLQPSCATPALVRGDSAYTISATPVNPPKAMAGTDATRSGSSRLDCAAAGMSPVNGTQGTVFSSGRTVLESVGVDCSVLTPTLDGDNHLQLAFTPDDDRSGAASVQIGGTPWNDRCGAHEVLVGFAGRVGAQMDQIQGICAELVIDYL